VKTSKTWKLGDWSNQGELEKKKIQESLSRLLKEESHQKELTLKHNQVQGRYK
jgi:hypothetical protein